MLELKVQEAQQDDIGRGIIRLDSVFITIHSYY